MGCAGLTSSQGLIGAGGCLWHRGCLWQQLLLSVRGRQRGGALIRTCQREKLARSPRADGSPIVLGCYEGCGHARLYTKPLAPWRLLARVSLPAWIAGQGECQRCGSPPRTAGPAGHPACAGVSPGGGRGRRHPGSASWRGGAGRGGQETPAGIAQLRETLCRPAVRAPAAWRGLEVKGGGAGERGQCWLAPSQAELGRSRLVLSGEGREEMLAPLLGASFGCRGSPSFWSPQGKSGFSLLREPICG